MQNFSRRPYYLLSVILVLVALVMLSACSSSSKDTTNTIKSTSSSSVTTIPGQGVIINLVMQDYAFDQNTITVPASANVTINFNNRDFISHSFALYTDSSATTAIYVGRIVYAENVVYNFTAPETPGNYYFRCTQHPKTENGTFVVQ